MVVQHGGAEIFVKELLKELKKIENKNTYELWVLHDAEELLQNNEEAIKFENDYIKELEKNGINVIKFHKKEGIKQRLKLYKEIRKRYKEVNPDIIHCHLETVTINICLALLLKKVKIIETIHNIKISHKNILKFFIAKKVNKIITIANSVNQMLINNIKINKKKVYQIYNGIDISKFRCVRKFDENKKNINVVAIGRLEKQKNYYMMLESFKKLTKKCKRKNIAVNLSIYGQGTLKDSLIKYIDDNKMDNVQLKGITTDIPLVLAQNDIYLMTSIYEGLSISLIEALVSGISIICTDVGGNEEIIHEGAGVLIKSENVDECFEALYELSTNTKKRKELYDNCIRSAKRFDMEICGKEHLKLYNTL